MGLRAIVNELQLELNNYFVGTEKEWVNLSLEAATRVDIKMVSDKTSDKNTAEQFIKDKVEYLNEKSEYIDLVVGFLEFYTVDEAEMLEVERPVFANKEVVSFGDMVDILTQPRDIKSKNKAKVISFYSYKGGVGRTVSLIQSAYNLAKKGKKVALIDLDIEAPSFNSIFREDIKNSNGLVDYLFNRYSKNESETSKQDEIKSIVSKLNINTKGEIYVVPCGNVDVKYVKNLQIIKEKVIYQNNYIREFINKIVEEYNVDYVFIDSRTGINNWGALAIADIADEVFLVAYPNYENYEGIKLILDLIQDIKKCTIIFSRIDTSGGGQKIALDLFNKLELKQNFIGISYDPKIAINDKYPIENINSFDEISEFILENDQLIENRKWINKNPEEVKSILSRVTDKKNLNKIRTNNEGKMLDKSNLMVVSDNTIDIKALVNNINEKYNVVFFDDKYMEWYKKSISKIDKNNLIYFTTLLLSAGIVFMEDSVFNRESVELEFINEAIELANNLGDNEGRLNVEKMISQLTKLDEKNNNVLNYVFFDFNELHNILKEVNEILTTDRIISIILLTIKGLNFKNYINAKLLINIEEYNKYIDYFEKYSADILEISWKTKNNKERLAENIKEVLNLTESVILDNNKLKQLDGLESLTLESLTNETKESLLNRNLLYCKRIDSNKYSQELNYYIAEKIKESSELSKKYILKLIERAAEQELRDLDSDVERYSIIGIDSFSSLLN